MDKMSLSADWFGREQPILPFTIDGEDLDPAEELQPRKDFGPIGPKKKAVWDDLSNCDPSTGLIFSWVSDYIRPGGGLYSEDVFKLGIVPGMPPPPPSPKPQVPEAPVLTPPGVIGYCVGSTASSSSGYSTSQSMNEYEPPSPPAGAYTPYYPSQHVQYSLLRQVQEQQQVQQQEAQTPSPPPPLLSLPIYVKMSARESSNKADIREFTEQYGKICGKLRPNHYYRPRKGKYFKKFEES